MTPEAMRIAIAEACRWKPDRRGHWKSPHGNCHDDIDGLPNFPENLDACAEMRKCVPKGKRQEYGIVLVDLVARDLGDEWVWNVADATAAQHCETFLRVMERWVEE